LAYTIDPSCLNGGRRLPNLPEFTARALELLHAQSSKGFFLIIDGSGIDTAAHSNDPATHIHEILTYNKAFEIARKFTERYGGVLISVSDHETGGLAVGRETNTEYPEYVWHPDVLASQKCSTEAIGHSISINNVHPYRTSRDEIKRWLCRCKIRNVTEEEIDGLFENRRNATIIDHTLANILSRQAQIGVLFLLYQTNHSGLRVVLRHLT
jgi:alkaline phosphatase